MLVIGGSELLIEVRELAEYPSHGGSQGFKSPHLHPTTALVSGLVGHLHRAGAVPGAFTGQQTGSNRERNGQPLLDCGHETERSGHVPGPPITRRMLGVDLDGSQTDLGCSRRVPCRPDGSRRIQKDRLVDDQRAIKGHPTKNRRQVKRLRLITLIAARGPRHEFCVEVPTSQPNA
jgi:hypothetical protein